MNEGSSFSVFVEETRFLSNYTGAILRERTFFSPDPMFPREFCSEALQPPVRRLRIEADTNCQKAVKTLCCTVMTSLDGEKAYRLKQERVSDSVQYIRLMWC